MKQYISSILILLFFSCSDNSRQNSHNKKTTIEWFVPEEDIVISLDTIVTIDNTKFIVSCKYNAIPNQTTDISSESEDTIYIEKTRNYSAEVSIDKDNTIIFKKIFTKDDFKTELGMASLYHYILTEFQFEGIEKDKIVFKSSICLNNSDDLTTTEVVIDTSGVLTMQKVITADNE